MHLNSSSFHWWKIKFCIPLFNPIFKCVRNYPAVKILFITKLPAILTQEGKFELRKTTKKAISKGLSYSGQETGDRRLESGDGRLESGDGRQETRVRRRETGDEQAEDWRWETGDWQAGDRRQTGGRQAGYRRQTGGRQETDRRINCAGLG